MRVLHVVATTLRRGAEVFATGLTDELADAGVEQLVVVLCGREADLRYDVPAVVLRDGRADPHTPKLDPGLIVQLHSCAKEFRPDIVQAHGGGPLKYAVLAGLHRRSKLVYRRIGTAAGWIEGSAQRALHAWTARRADRVVALGEASANEALVEFGIDPASLTVIPNGVDARRLVSSTDPAKLRAEFEIPSNATVVTSIGALSEEKNPLGHVRVAASMASGHPGLFHLLVGEGPQRGQVDTAVKGEGVDGCMRVLGATNRIGDVLAVTDVLLVTSRTEGMPGVVIEAGMVGVPTVGYAVGSMPELVSHGDTGWLVAAGDSAALVAALERVIGDSELLTRLGKRAAELYREKFDLTSVAKSYLAMYRDIHSEPSTARVSLKG